MRKEEITIQTKIRDLREQVDSMKRKVANIDFSYQDPAPNFDRSKVKGLVAQLFTLDKSHVRAGTALEICAGGRLYNVVVDTSATGTQLLQNGRLKKRVTIIPLDKISAFRASSQVRCCSSPWTLLIGRRKLEQPRNSRREKWISPFHLLDTTTRSQPRWSSSLVQPWCATTQPPRRP